MSTQAEVTTLCGAADTPVSMDSPSVLATEIGDLQPSATNINAINRLEIDMNPIHDYAVKAPAIDSNDIDIKSIIEIDEHSIDVKSEDIDATSNIDVMSINRIEVDTTLTQVKIERMECAMQDISTKDRNVDVISINRIIVDTALTQVKIERVECDIQVISTDNIKVEQEIDFGFADVKDEKSIIKSERTNRIEVDPLAIKFESTSKLAHKLQAAQNVRPNKAVTRAISQQKTRDLVLEFNLRELRVRLVKLSDSQIEKLTHTHSGDKSTSSRSSQDVTSSDGKHNYSFDNYINYMHNKYIIYIYAD
jgi:hypothetical protein